MGIASDERRALCDLFDELGPDAPTLCGGWQTRDLAAHLAVRERRIDAAPGIVAKPLEAHLQRVQDDYAAKPWRDLVSLVRSGPAWFWPSRIGPIDEVINTAEYFVHHEDVRRAQPEWAPREPTPRRDRAVWGALTRAGMVSLRNCSVGVIVRAPSGRMATVKRGPNAVTIVGEPGELLLYA
ncbi:MAG: TIGR03085 family metal-binding protein, partial [Pseudonocardiaceae bacterium]